MLWWVAFCGGWLACNCPVCLDFKKWQLVSPPSLRFYSCHRMCCAKRKQATSQLSETGLVLGHHAHVLAHLSDPTAVVEAQRLWEQQWQVGRCYELRARGTHTGIVWSKFLPCRTLGLEAGSAAQRFLADCVDAVSACGRSVSLSCCRQAQTSAVQMQALLG